VRPHEIETARLRLRPLAKADVDELHPLWSSHEVRRYLWDNEVIDRQWTASLVAESLSLFAAHGYGLWGARHHDREELVGFGGFWYFHTPPKLELLYGIAPEHWNRGLASEIAQALVCYGFEELEFSEVWASMDASNVASTSVLKQAGLRFERRAVVDGLETHYYSLPRSAFQPVGQLLMLVEDRLTLPFLDIMEG
jgi:[ribosomal protein S5]-alanine N-acetyltransferase